MCDKKCVSREGLKRHCRIHKGIIQNQFQCTVCPKSYTLSSNLTRHKRKHSNSRMQIEETNLFTERTRFGDSSSGGRPSTGPISQLQTLGPSPFLDSLQSPVSLSFYLPHTGMFPNGPNFQQQQQQQLQPEHQQPKQPEKRSDCPKKDRFTPPISLRQSNKVSSLMGEEATSTFGPLPSRSPLSAATETDEKSSKRRDHSTEAERMKISSTKCETSSSNDETYQPLDLRIETKRSKLNPGLSEEPKLDLAGRQNGWAVTNF